MQQSASSESDEKFKQQILLCLNSANDFKANSKPIRDKLQTQDKASIAIFLDTIQGIIVNNKASPETRFYSLFFLKATTERSNPQLMKDLTTRSKLLKRFEEDATFDKDKTFPARGASFFKANPSEKDKSTGNNYLALILEMIMYWNFKYGSKDKNKENQFNVLYKRLTEVHKVPFPSKYHFYKGVEPPPVKQKTGGDISKAESISSPGINSERSSVQQERKKKEEVTKSPGTTASHEEKAREKLANLENVINLIKEAYEANPSEPEEFESIMSYYLKELKDVNKTFDEPVGYFIDNAQPKYEQILSDLLGGSSKASRLEETYELYTNKIVQYPEHRQAMLDILIDNKAPITPEVTPQEVVEDVAMDQKIMMEPKQEEEMMSSSVADPREERKDGGGHKLSSSDMIRVQNALEDNDVQVQKAQSKQNVMTIQKAPTESEEEDYDVEEKPAVHMEPRISIQDRVSPSHKSNPNQILPSRAGNPEDFVERRSTNSGIRQSSLPLEQKMGLSAHESDQIPDDFDDSQDDKIRVIAVSKVKESKPLMDEARVNPDVINQLRLAEARREEEKKQAQEAHRRELMRLAEEEEQRIQEEEQRLQEEQREKEEKRRNEIKRQEELRVQEELRIQKELMSQEEQRKEEERVRKEAFLKQQELREQEERRREEEERLEEERRKEELKRQEEYKKQQSLQKKEDLKRQEELRREEEEREAIRKHEELKKQELLRQQKLKEEKEQEQRKKEEERRKEEARREQEEYDRQEEEFRQELLREEEEKKLKELERVQELERQEQKRQAEIKRKEDLKKEELRKEEEAREREVLRKQEEQRKIEEARMRDPKYQMLERSRKLVIQAQVFNSSDLLDDEDHQQETQKQTKTPTPQGSSSSPSKRPKKVIVEKQVLHASDLIDDVDDPPRHESENPKFFSEYEESEQPAQKVPVQKREEPKKVAAKQMPEIKTEIKSPVPEEMSTLSMQSNANGKKMMMQSLDSRSMMSNMSRAEEDDKLSRKTMTHSVRSTASNNSVRFANDLKQMEKSIKLSRDRSNDLQTINNNIRRSFTATNKKPPPAFNHVLVEPDLLSKFEQELNQLRQENESLKSASNSVLHASHDYSSKASVSELQRQCTDYQKQVEMLKKRNEALERSLAQSEKSSPQPQDLVQRLKELELENQSLRKSVNDSVSSMSFKDDGRGVREKLKELSNENNLLTKTMANLKNENQALQAKVSDLEEVVSNSRHDDRDIVRSRERSLITTNKTEMMNQQMHVRIDSPTSQISEKQSPKIFDNPKVDWVVSGDNHKSPTGTNMLLKELTEHLSPIEARGASPHYKLSNKNELSYNEGRNQVVHEMDSPEKDRRKAVSSTQNVEIARKSSKPNEDQYLSANNNNRVPAYSGNNSQDLSDPNERFETPDNLSGNEDNDYFKKPVDPNEVYLNQKIQSNEYNQPGERNVHAHSEMPKGRQQKNVMAVNNRYVEAENPVVDEEQGMTVKARDFINNSRSYEQEWNQKTGKSPDQFGKNPFESEYEFTKKLKGTTVPTNLYIFEELRNRLLAAPFENNLHYFKMSCLKGKCPIYDNDIIQVGASASVVQDYSTGNHQLKLGLFFANKTDEPIHSFSTSLTEGLNLEVTAKPEIIEPTIIKGKQNKQLLLISFKNTPVSCLQLNCEALWGRQSLSFSLYLPTTLNKFMEFKYVDADEFRGRWKMYSSNTLKTETMYLDNTIVRSAHDFKKYFAYLIDLKPDDEYDFIQGKKSIKLGGVFELKEAGSEYALKINVLPSHEVVFQIATAPRHTETAKFIMQNLIFLFRKQ